MHGKAAVYQTMQHQAIGEMIDAEAALGPDPHPAVRSWVTGNAAAAGIVRAMLDQGHMWTRDGLQLLLDQLEGPDTPAPLPAAPYGQQLPDGAVCVICQQPCYPGEGYTVGNDKATWYVHGHCHRRHPDYEFAYGVGKVAPHGGTPIDHNRAGGAGFPYLVDGGEGA